MKQNQLMREKIFLQFSRNIFTMLIFSITPMDFFLKISISPFFNESQVPQVCILGMFVQVSVIIYQAS